LLELFKRDAELPENFEEERRANFSPGMEGDRHGRPSG
jgi:hypothetical protein